MAKKKGNNNESDQKNKDDNGGGKKKENGSGGGGGGGGGGVVVVLKMDLHCKGCAAKVIKCVKSFDGVEWVKGGDGGEMNKLTVAGKVDPAKLRERLEKKTKKKVEIISPILPKKEKDKDKEKGNNDKEMKGNVKNKENSEAEEKNKKHKSEDNKCVKQKDEKNKKNNKAEDKNVKKGDDKKSKEPPVTTVVLKVNWHCQGCIRKIESVVTKTKGYKEMSFDCQKHLLMVKGLMDPKVLVESLKKRLKRPVEIVPSKKEGSGEKGKGGGVSKGGGGGGGDSESKAEGGSGGKGADNTGGSDGGSKGEVHRMEYVQSEYPYPLIYGSGYLVEYVHAPQLFSDENPNACVVM